MTWTYDKDKITYFAATDFRGQRVKFGIRAEDRARHMYIIGKTGLGKSTLLENLAVQDIMNDEGMCFIDPHGGSAEALLNYVPEHRIKDVIYFAPFDMDWPVALNVLENTDPNKRPLIASGILATFKKVWPDAWSGRMEYFLMNTLLALLETPGSTLLGVNRMYADKEYRDKVIANVTDTSVRAFWLDEFANMTEKMVAEATPAIQNKVGQFSMNPIMRNVLGQSESTFDMRWMMDNRKIFIVNLSKGRVGETNAALLGALLVTKLYLAAMSRSEMSPEELKSAAPFYLYVDEFQNFANESFADILAEARKYKLCLTVAHQYIEQMTEEVRDAVFGNVGTMIAFRVGATDAEVLEKEFAPVFTVEDIVGLGFAQIYLKLMIKGASSAPFSARTEDRPPMPTPNFAQACIEASRNQFARPRAQVEEEIKQWFGPGGQGKIGVGDDRPKTQKYAPGTRPDRPRVDMMTPRQGGTPGAFGRQGTPGAFGRQGGGTPGAFGRQDAGDRPQAGGLALRDALARANIAQPGAPMATQSPQYPAPQQPPQSVAEMTGHMPWSPPPLQQQSTPEAMHPYAQQPAPYGYPQAPQYPVHAYPQQYPYPQPQQPHPGYPYALPPQFPPQYYPQPYYPHPYAQYPQPAYSPQPQYPPQSSYPYAPQPQQFAASPQPMLAAQEPLRATPPAPHSEPRSTRDDRSSRTDREERPARLERDERPPRENRKPDARRDEQKPQRIEKPREERQQESPERSDLSEKNDKFEKRERVEKKPNLAKPDTKGPSSEKLDVLAAALAKLKEKNAVVGEPGTIHHDTLDAEQTKSREDERTQRPAPPTIEPQVREAQAESAPAPAAPPEVPHDVLRSVLDS